MTKRTDRIWASLRLVTLAVASLTAGCTAPMTNDRDSHKTSAVEKRIKYSEVREPCAVYTPERRALFGDLHVHSAYSFDAAANSLETYPRDAYRFAKGEAIPFFPLDDDGKAVGSVQLPRPLDFVAVTDHGEFLGERALCRTPGSPKYDSRFCHGYRETERQGMMMLGTIIDMENPKRFEELCGDDGALCREYAEGPWQEMIAAAEDSYDRTSNCSFTSLIGYEYTGTPGLSNIHRNVIFRNGVVPKLPVSYIEAPRDQMLWEKLGHECDQQKGCEFITIPHNSNLANGRMFSLIQGGNHDDDHHQEGTGNDHGKNAPNPPSLSDQKDHAIARQHHEPVMEIFQHKGNSECMNGISGVFGEPDEHCEFESVRKFAETNRVVGLRVVDSELQVNVVEVLTDECGQSTGGGGMVGGGCVHETDFLRSHLLNGLRDEQRLGVNSAKVGVIGSTDTHVSTPGAVSETNWEGHVSGEATPTERLQPGLLTSGIDGNPGGLAGVWAVENSRDAIFDAMIRREVFGTSGPRIKPRFFAGWNFSENLCAQEDLVKQAYRQGVPMGGDLHSRPDDHQPMLVAIAHADDASDATPLQKLQIIKGWVDSNGDGHYKVFDVAGSSDSTAYVDESTGTRHGDGYDSLCAVFTDPEFDPEIPAYYYLRVLENPSPRWSLADCLRIPAAQRPEVCHEDSNVPKVIQEMAWSSPIWYRPK